METPIQRPTEKNPYRNRFGSIAELMKSCDTVLRFKVSFAQLIPPEKLPILPPRKIPTKVLWFMG
jgi:hypothetical protein